MPRFIILVAFLSSCFASAQDVPPPPKPEMADHPLSVVLESLKDTLLSFGRIETVSNANNHYSQQITRVSLDVQGCQARVQYDSWFNGNGPSHPATSLFFESIDTVEAVPQQEAHDRSRSQIGKPRTLTFSKGAYALIINGNNTFPLLLPNEAQAIRAADAVSGAAQICRSAPFSLNAAAGTPGLAETLQFIQEKLNNSGEVNYRGIYERPDGTPIGDAISTSSRISRAVADPSSCLLRFNLRSTFNSDGSERREVISFRRVEQLEVATEQDAVSRASAQSSQTNRIYKTEPLIYLLSVMYVGGDRLLLHFTDEEVANRVAKAMNHAVELCGGWSKDPFL